MTWDQSGRLNIRGFQKLEALLEIADSYDVINQIGYIKAGLSDSTKLFKAAQKVIENLKPPMPDSDEDPLAAYRRQLMYLKSIYNVRRGQSVRQLPSDKVMK